MSDRQTDRQTDHKSKTFGPEKKWSQRSEKSRDSVRVKSGPKRAIAAEKNRGKRETRDKEID